VFLLRDYRISFTQSQRFLLGKIIKLTGGVLFTSDDTGRYGAAEKEFLKYMLEDRDQKITGVDFRKNIYTVDYTENGEAKRLRFNLKTGKEF
jgi:hypothetical protein